MTGGGQRGESWALENVLNPISGSQGQTVNSPCVQISLKTDCICVTTGSGLVWVCIYMDLFVFIICYCLSLLNIFNIYTVTVVGPCMLMPVLSILASPVVLLML